MFAYMKNIALYREKWEGMLLYPTVNDEFTSATWNFNGHKIHAKTINLNLPWTQIHQNLIDLITIK